MRDHAPDDAADAASHALWGGGRHSISQIAARPMPAQITWLKPKTGGAEHITALQALRERLIADLREARRRHRSTSEVTARLRAVILEILTN